MVKRVATMTRLGPVAGLLLIATASSVHGAPTSSVGDVSEEVMNKARELDDREMSDMRGRFVEGGKVSYFGLKMETTWETPNGSHYAVEGGWEVDNSGDSPIVSTSSNIRNEESEREEPGSGNDSKIVDGGSDNGRGVVQVIQAGGNLNVAGNDFQLSVSPDGRVDPVDGNQKSSVDSGPVDMEVISGAGHMGTRIAVEGHGEAVQQVRRGRGVHQSVQLKSDMQRVSNITQVEMQMDKGDLGARIDSSLRDSLESARGLNR